MTQVNINHYIRLHIFLKSKLIQRKIHSPCSLIRNILGSGAHTSVKIDDFDKDFRLESLVGKYAIITDENPVGTYIDSSSNLKAIITQDTIQLTRKFKSNINFAPTVFIIQCLNDIPRIKDNTDSFWRRMLLVPFDMPAYYSMDCPKACEHLLDTAKIANNTVLQFWDEFKTQFVWDMLPLTFLYPIFVAWSKEVNPSGLVISRLKFKELLIHATAGELEF